MENLRMTLLHALLGLSEEIPIEVVINLVRLHPATVQELLARLTWLHNSGNLDHEYLTSFPDITVDEFLAPIVPPSHGGQDIVSYARNLPLPQKLQLLKELARGCSHLHSRNVVHGNFCHFTVRVTDKGRLNILYPVAYTLLSRLVLRYIPVLEMHRYQSPCVSNPSSDDDLPTSEDDVSSFASLAYAVFTGAPPFSPLDLTRYHCED